jgi:hypothetical protein
MNTPQTHRSPTISSSRPKARSSASLEQPFGRRVRYAAEIGVEDWRNTGLVASARAKRVMDERSFIASMPPKMSRALTSWRPVRMRAPSISRGPSPAVRLDFGLSDAATTQLED